MKCRRWSARALRRGHGSSAGTFPLLAAVRIDGVFHLLAFRKTVEPAIGNRRMVEEYVATVGSLNEAEALVLDNLFNCTQWHACHSLPDEHFKRHRGDAFCRSLRMVLHPLLAGAFACA